MFIRSNWFLSKFSASSTKIPVNPALVWPGSKVVSSDISINSSNIPLSYKYPIKFWVLIPIFSKLGIFWASFPSALYKLLATYSAIVWSACIAIIVASLDNLIFSNSFLEINF